MKAVFIILAIVGVSHAAVTARDQLAKLVEGKIDEAALRQAREDASDYLDQILATVREALPSMGMSVIPLPNATSEFSQEIGGVLWHGEAALYDGSLANIDTIHRTGSAELVMEENGDMVISAEVGVNKGMVHYEMIVTFMDLGPHAVANGTLSRVRALFSLRISPDLKMTLEAFDVKDTGILSLDVTGLGAVLNFLVEILVDFIGNLVKGIVVTLLEGTIKDLINDIIGGLTFPSEIFTAVHSVQEAIIASF